MEFMANMADFFPQYFLQTKQWADFWATANKPNHQYFYFENEYFEAYVYEYPWYFGEKFWYVPKGPATKKSFNKDNFKEFYNQILTAAKSQGITYIKWDFDESFTKSLEISSNPQLAKFILEIDENYETRLSSKTLQFLITSTLEIEKLTYDKNPENQYSPERLGTFFNQNLDFWAVTNKNTRRCTRKALQANWQISTEKTQENFEKFWTVYDETRKRQNFSTQSKDYTQQLFNQDFSRVIILSDENGPQSVWFGIASEKTITYIYGGNTTDSFGKFGQYLAHLAALQMILLEGRVFYDFGGYDITKGYGKFKENYKGTIREFLGPIDILLKPLKFNLISFIIRILKFIQRK